MTSKDIREAIIANGWQAKTPGEIATLLNAPRVTRTERMIGIGSVMDALGVSAGASLLDQMELEAETNPVVKWGMRLLNNAQLDVALDSTRAMLDALLPVEAAAVLKGLAEQTITAGVTVQAVIDAMEGM